MQSIIQTDITFMGFDARLTAEYEVTYLGHPAIIDHIYGSEPAGGPEWEVLSIGMTLSLDDGDGAEWMLDWRDAAFHVLANCERVDAAILRDIESADERYFWDAA